MTTLPKISAYCLTYRSPDVLEEALFSFLIQDYPGEKELVILNDEPEQPLFFDHPQVKVVNMASRAPDIATKYNHAVSLCSGDIRVPWDDDDICLPTRLSTIVREFSNGCWFSDLILADNPNDDSLRLATGPIHNNHATTPNFFIRCGAYHDVPNQGYDFRLMRSIRQARPAIKETAPTYIYRKHSISKPNHSNHIAKSAIEPELDHYKSYAEELSGFEKGKRTLSPHWSKQWVELAREAIASGKAPDPLHLVDPVYPNIKFESKERA